MTPLRLEITGFTCFKEQTRIDFSDLSLFAISGPTGAGKSTLLDAMTYALYGQIARLGSKGLDLISPGLNQMSVQFEFQNHQGIYRVTRTLDRKKTRNDAQTRIEKMEVDANWKQLPESEKIKEANIKLEQLVGLDYEGFTRAILLPQGAFDEFLRGDPSQRRQLLVSLLNLDKVQKMQQEAGQRAKQAEMQIRNIESRLNEDYQDATPERKRELNETLDTLLAEQVTLSKQYEDLQNELRDLEALKALVDEHLKVQKTLSDLKSREHDIQLDKTRLEQGRRVEFLLPLLTQFESLGGSVQTLEITFKTKQADFEKRNLELSKTREVMQAFEEKSHLRLPEIDAHLSNLASFIPLIEQLKVRGGSLALASQTTDVEYSESSWEHLQRTMAQLPVLHQSDKNLRILEQELSEVIHKQDALGKTVQGLEKQLELLTEKGKQARVVFEDAKAVYEQAVIQDQAAVLREHLHQGDRCPVCEQEVSVLPPLRQIQVGELKQRRDELEQELKHFQDQYTEVRANLSAHKQRLQEQKQTHDAIRLKHEDAKGNLERELANYSSFGNNLNEISTGLQAAKQNLLIALAASIQMQTGGIDVAELQKTLRQEKREITERLKNVQSEFRQIERAVDQLQSEINSLTNQLEQTKQHHRELSSTIQTSLHKAQFESIEKAKQAALSSDDLKRLEIKLNTYTSQKESAERRDVELQAKLSGRNLDNDYLVKLQQESSQYQRHLDELKEAVGRTRQQLNTIEKMLERSIKLRRERDALSKTFDTFNQLSIDLRGNNFQDYLLNQMQSKLAARASHMIRDVTDQRYDLRLLDGEYQVFDAWTQENRSVKTLSGGETFIASLALALSLSDLLAGSKALGALFLDEGFGTLDSETLDQVADVLETLSQQGRMVGVITHVQALSERLPARLVVKKSAEGSSISWDV